MITLSAVIITFNEAKNIARCLESLVGVADEIVVVDSFSKDDTVAICQAHGATVIQHAFGGHIEQKNYALTHATHEWALSLDADEVLTDELRASILAVKQQPAYDGYYMNRLNNYCGHWIHHSGWYPDRKLRLFKREKGKWGGTNPHDKYELLDAASPVGFLQGDLQHYSYYTVDEHNRKEAYFADIAAKAYFAKGKRNAWLHLFLNPPIKFLRNYVIKRGFLDGKAGFTICKITAYGTYLKYKKLLDLQRSV